MEFLIYFFAYLTQFQFKDLPRLQNLNSSYAVLELLSYDSLELFFISLEKNDYYTPLVFFVEKG